MLDGSVLCLALRVYTLPLGTILCLYAAFLNALPAKLRLRLNFFVDRFIHHTLPMKQRKPTTLER